MFYASVIFETKILQLGWLTRLLFLLCQKGSKNLKLPPTRIYSRESSISRRDTNRYGMKKPSVIFTLKQNYFEHYLCKGNKTLFGHLNPCLILRQPFFTSLYSESNLIVSVFHFSNFQPFLYKEKVSSMFKIV